MIKYIKLNDKKIVEVRPLLPADFPVEKEDKIEYIVNPELEAKFDKEFLRLDVPEGVGDVELMRNYYYQNGKFVKTGEIINRANLAEEYYELKEWLTQNDWKVNKVVLSEWESTDPRWVEYKEQRAVKRARLDKIKEALGI